MTYIKILLLILWLFIGAASFIYWWTKDQDLELKHIPLIVFVSSIGIFSFFIGWIMHGEPIKKGKVIFKKRSR